MNTEQNANIIKIEKASSQTIQPLIIITNCAVPSMLSRRRNSPTHSHDMCLCKTILVRHFAASHLGKFDTRKESFFCWLVEESWEEDSVKGSIVISLYLGFPHVHYIYSPLWASIQWIHSSSSHLWQIPKQLKKGFNSFCILGAWTIWIHRNTCVFDGSPPNLQVTIQAFKDEANLWQFAGAKGLTTLCHKLGRTQT